MKRSYCIATRDAIIGVMNRFHLNAFWLAAKEIEQQELRAAAIVKKWQEKHDIWCEATKYGVDPEKMEIWMRWEKLRRLYESGAWSGRPSK